MAATEADDAAARDRLLAEIAAGVHDGALIRLAAMAVADAEVSGAAAGARGGRSAWDDPWFVTWWVSRSQVRARRASGRMSDADLLAAGRALQARAGARSAGAQWHAARPVLEFPGQVAALGAANNESAKSLATPLVDLAVAAGVGRELWDEPVDTWVDLARSLNTLPPPGRYLALKVAGDSMEPVMHTGDTVLVALGQAPKAGALVVARVPDDGYVCKRVRRVLARAVELESLAPGRPLIRIPRDHRLMVGQVVAVWCHHCDPTSRAGRSVR